MKLQCVFFTDVSASSPFSAMVQITIYYTKISISICHAENCSVPLQMRTYCMSSFEHCSKISNVNIAFSIWFKLQCGFGWCFSFSTLSSYGSNLYLLYKNKQLYLICRKYLQGRAYCLRSYKILPMTANTNCLCIYVYCLVSLMEVMMWFLTDFSASHSFPVMVQIWIYYTKISISVRHTENVCSVPLQGRAYTVRR